MSVYLLSLSFQSRFTHQDRMEKKVDFLVIGSGLAGLSFALKVAEYGKVCIVTKAKLEETNTRYAQGGIAAVTYAPDNYEKHVKDTLIAGDNLCNEDVVRMVVSEAPGQIQELILWVAVDLITQHHLGRLVKELQFYRHIRAFLLRFRLFLQHG